MAEYIEREVIMRFPIRKDRCDKEHANEHFIFGIESVLEYVENLPAADVAPVVWIPVTERLPEDRSNVLVVAYWNERWGVYMGWCAPKRAEWSVHIGIGDRNDVAVTHWMPLPEPPKGVSDNG